MRSMPHDLIFPSCHDRRALASSRQRAMAGKSPLTSSSIASVAIDWAKVPIMRIFDVAHAPCTAEAVGCEVSPVHKAASFEFVAGLERY